MDEHNTSMEALKVDEDEDVKEVSLEEDILGAQSLLFSDSEEEADAAPNTAANASKKNSPNAAKKKEEEMQTFASHEPQRISEDGDEIISDSNGFQSDYSADEEVSRMQNNRKSSSAGKITTLMELEQYAKSIEDRPLAENESESDSESDLNLESEDDNRSLADTENYENSTAEIATIESGANNITENGSGNMHLTRGESAELEQTPSENVVQKPSTSIALITEVLELPKLDMNTVNIIPNAKPEQPNNIKETAKINEGDIGVSDKIIQSETENEDIKSEAEVCTDTFDMLRNLIRKANKTIIEYAKKPERIIDSDEEEISGTASIINRKNRNRVSALIDSDSADEGDHDDSCPTVNTLDNDRMHESTVNVKNAVKGIKKKKITKDTKTHKAKNKAKNKKISSLTESSDNEAEIRKTLSSLVDSESSQSENEAEDLRDDTGKNEALDVDDDMAKAGQTHKTKKDKPIRASAKRALDEMQAIQSEQQRLHREANISIPYHKPKKHSLQDFLNRRTLMKPISQSNSPIGEPLRSKNLKMGPEELQEYAKFMDERAKEATEFFKSESEDEELQDNVGVVDMENDENSSTELDKATASSDKEPCASEATKLTEEELAEILKDFAEEKEVKDSMENPSTSKVLITEVLELPKLDMNTINITPQKGPKRSINIKELLNNIDLPASPSLTGDPNKLIDLETGDLIERKPSGVENLRKRLMAANKVRKSKSSESCNILSMENGKLEMTKVSVNLKKDKNANKEPKPGAAFFELQKKLQGIIKTKRLKEIQKKQGDEIENSKSLEEDDDPEEMDIDSEMTEYEDETTKNNNVIEIDDEENALFVEDEDEEDNEGNADDDDVIVEIIQSDEDNNDIQSGADSCEEDSDNSSDQDNLTKDETDKTKRKNRIVVSLEDSDDEMDKDDIDFLKTQPPPTQPLILDTQPGKTDEDIDNELMALCSGSFDVTQRKSAAANALMSQIPLTQNQGKPVDDDELMGLCSGTFDQPSQSPKKFTQQPVCKRIISSEDEDDKEVSDLKTRVKKLTKKGKKKAKLGFSDDEDEDVVPVAVDNENDETNSNADGEIEIEKTEAETYVDYDSEENEIVVPMNKKDCLKRAENFLEKEAELSESEWESVDEDENNMDKYDIELGDEDEFDREELRTELGQIHARKMLDKDLQDVRKLKNILMEDEEQDGVGRQRQFKWKNAESGFSLDDGPRTENTDIKNSDSGDELTEHQWRKKRYEREQFLKGHGLKPGSQDVSTVLPNTTLLTASNSTVTSSVVTTKKIQIITAKKRATVTQTVSSVTKTASPFLISKGIAEMNKKSVRGSFLERDKETLNKLAGLTKGTAGSANAHDMDEAAGAMSIKSVKPKNFVFATLTEEEHQNMKRKSDDLLNSSNENGKNFMKKPKLEPRRDKCFIDQLL